jgi:hypothetical protein
MHPSILPARPAAVNRAVVATPLANHDDFVVRDD